MVKLNLKLKSCEISSTAINNMEVSAADDMQKSAELLRAKFDKVKSFYSEVYNDTLLYRVAIKYCFSILTNLGFVNVSAEKSNSELKHNHTSRRLKQLEVLWHEGKQGITNLVHLDIAGNVMTYVKIDIKALAELIDKPDDGVRSG